MGVSDTLSKTPFSGRSSPRQGPKGIPLSNIEPGRLRGLRDINSFPFKVLGGEPAPVRVGCPGVGSLIAGAGNGCRQTQGF